MISGFVADYRNWLMAVAMGFAGGLILLDETVVGIALPTVRGDLAMSQTTSHWVVSVYLLTFTAFAAAGGRLGDLFGLRRVMFMGLGIFGLASLAAGMASDGAWLIAARALQGVGAAVIFPLSVAMITACFPKEKRGAAIGVSAAIGTIFLASGPLVGGLFTEFLSWRWIFWINLPITLLVALLVTALWQEPPQSEGKSTIDLGGLCMLVLGLVALVFAIMEGPRLGWRDPIILGALVCGTIALATLPAIERRQAEPLIDIDLFRGATFSAAVLTTSAAQYTKVVIVVFGASFFQEALNMKPLAAGWALLAAFVATPFAATAAGHAADRYGARLLALSGLATTAGAVLWITVLADSRNYFLIAPGLLVFGASLPFCFLSAIRSVVNAVPVNKQGQAGGIQLSARLLGGTLGVAISSTVLHWTGSFQLVFLSTTALLIAVLVVAWYAMERPSSA